MSLSRESAGGSDVHHQSVIWHCRKCGQRMTIVAGAPIHCACGWSFADHNDEQPERRIEVACRYRGNHTGQFLKRRCAGCSPTVPVYKCKLWRLCTEAASSDRDIVRYCGDCRDYAVKER